MTERYDQVGVRCPACQSARTTVTMTRAHDGRTFRRRKCKSCGKLFTTTEQYTPGPLHAAALAQRDKEEP
jgi:transcriptional regulator NrdR family protein